jgi:glycosyltransferase involved in cell wall biosynthesis
VNSFIQENLIKITFYKQQNKGKHFAINKGVQLAKGELFLILDSDDELPKNALDNILFYYNKIINNESIAGIAGRRNFSDGSIVGSENFDELISNSLDIRYKYHVTGDLVEIFRTNILKEFAFPEIENEKFCPEALLWNRISQKYNLLFFNKGIYTTQYLEDGLTAKIVKIRMTSPIASMLCYSELASYSIPFIEKVKANINFWRFSFNSDLVFMKKFQTVNAIFSLIGLPLGFIMYQNDKRKWL